MVFVAEGDDRAGAEDASVALASDARELRGILEMALEEPELVRAS